MNPKLQQCIKDLEELDTPQARRWIHLILQMDKNHECIDEDTVELIREDVNSLLNKK